MSNKLSGKIIATLPEVGGTSKSGNAWRKKEYVLETLDSKYPKKICFQVMNDKIDKLGFAEGATVDIEFDIESHEYNGRWYTSVNVWNGEVKSVAQVPQPAVAYAQPTEIPTPSQGDPLPF